MTDKTFKKFSPNFIGELFVPESGGYIVAYPAKVLDNIFKELKISDVSKQITMKDAIFEAASAFEMGKHNYLTWYKTSGEIKTLMGDLHKTTANGAKVYKEILSHPTYRMHLMSHLIKEFRENNNTGLPFISKDGESLQVYDFAALQFLEFLSKSSKTAMQSSKDINPATSPSYAMDKWLKAIHKGWKDCSPVKFITGKPYAKIGYNSQAILTLVKIMRPLDPVVTKEMISTALRKVQEKDK